MSLNVMPDVSSFKPVSASLVPSVWPFGGLPQAYGPVDLRCDLEEWNRFWAAGQTDAARLALGRILMRLTSLAGPERRALGYLGPSLLPGALPVEGTTGERAYRLGALAGAALGYFTAAEQLHLGAGDFRGAVMAPVQRQAARTRATPAARVQHSLQGREMAANRASRLGRNRVAAERRAQGWIQVDLASAAGISLRKIQRVEAGLMIARRRAVAAQCLHAIASALEAEFDELFTEPYLQYLHAHLQAREFRGQYPRCQSIPPSAWRDSDKLAHTRPFVWHLPLQVIRPSLPDATGPEALDEAVDRHLLVAVVQKVITALNERERLVVVLRFGLDGAGARSVAETAAALGLSPQQVIAAEWLAIRALRHPTRNTKLREYVED